MTTSFNLLDVPWVRCVGLKGEETVIGLRELFSRAHLLREIAEPQPLVGAGVLRLMVAILYRVAAPPGVEAWRERWDRMAFDAQVGDYLESQRERFDLLHPKHPFYQVRQPKGKTLAATELDFTRTTATNIRHFSHDRDFWTGLTLAECARGLIALPAFCPAGGAGKAPAINGNQMGYFFLRGKNLFETLMLNLPVRDAMKGCPSLTVAGDCPAWEGTPAAGDTVGLLEGLSWQARSIDINPDTRRNDIAGDVIREIVFGKGKPSPKERVWSDPFRMAARVPNPEGASNWYHRFWRDAAGDILLACTGGEGVVPILQQAGTLAQAVALEDFIELEQVSFHVRQATPLNARRQHWRVPAALWRDEAARSVVDELLAQSTKHIRQFGKQATPDELISVEADSCRRFQRLLHPPVDAATLDLQSRADDYLKALKERSPARANRPSPEKGEDDERAMDFVNQLAALSGTERARIRSQPFGTNDVDVPTYDLFNAAYWAIRGKNHKLNRQACFLAFMLYPWNTLPSGRGNLGASMDRALSSQPENRRSALIARFLDLLDRPRGSIDLPLLQLVQLLGARSVAVPIDWSRFIRDVGRWSNPDRPVQRAWEAACFNHLKPSIKGKKS